MCSHWFCRDLVLRIRTDLLFLNFFPGVSSAAVVGLPPFILPKFNLTAILIMAPIAIATMMEHIGDISAISATVGQNFIEDPGLHRTLIGDGIATSISAMIGGPANTTYGENTGVPGVVPCT